MTLELASTGESLRAALHDWHVERDQLDSQLSESLDALAAYQSHLDQWQTQLAAERETLQREHHILTEQRDDLNPALESLALERDEIRLARDQLNDDLAAAEALRFELDQRHQELEAAQGELDRFRGELESTRNQLETDRSACQKSAEQLDRERENLRASRERLEVELSGLQAARSQLERERSELADVRSQFDRGSVASDGQHHEETALLRAELNAARDKISSLTTSLLERTEELRTLDNRRAEAVTELELSRAREADLKADLEQQQRTAEQESQQRKEELRELRELLQCRIEDRPVESISLIADAALVVESAPPAASAMPHSTTATISRQNPVLGSIVQQFDKLRQQRATDRNLGSKPR